MGRAGIIKLPGMSMRKLDEVQYREVFKPTTAHVAAMSKVARHFDYSSIISRIHKGFFPELYETECDLKDWADYHSSYFQTYIEKDIKDALNIQDEMALIKFVKAAASLTGAMLNYTAIAEVWGKDVGTVKARMSVLESSGLVYSPEPYYNNYNKRLIKTPKLYFLDTGLACWLLGWNTPEQHINGAMQEPMFESFVIAEVLKGYYYDGNVKLPLYYYRDKDKNELDLLVEDGGILHPIEIKTTSDPNTSMTHAFRYMGHIPDKTLGQGAVICMAKGTLPLGQDVWTRPVNYIYVSAEGSLLYDHCDIQPQIEVYGQGRQHCQPN